MSSTEITSVEQFEYIIYQNQYVLILFYAPWCVPCRNLALQFDAIKSSFPQLAIVKIDVDEEELQSIVQQHSVTSLPYTFLYHNQRIAESFVGYSTEALWALASRAQN